MRANGKFERKHYKMTDEEIKQLRNISNMGASKAAIDDYIKHLSKKYKFIPETVDKWEGMDDQHFTAVSNE